jgi:hypothetical protein
MRDRIDWRPWVGLSVSVACIALVLHDVQMQELWERLQEATVGHVVLGLTFFIGALLIKAKRWQVLLSAIEPISLTQSFKYLMIGRLGSNLLPFRAGDALRLVLLGRKRALSKSAILATVVVEQLVDILSLVVFLFILLLSMNIPLIVKKGAGLSASIAAAGVFGLWFLARHPGISIKLQRLIPQPVPERIRNKTAALVDSFIDGLRSLRSFKQLSGIAGWSILSWTLVAISVAFFLRAVSLHRPWYVSLLIVVVTNLGGIIPASPGSMGTFHFLVAFSLSLLSVDKEASLGFALIYHETVFLIVTGIGALCLWREGLSIARVREYCHGQRAERAKSCPQ